MTFTSQTFSESVLSSLCHSQHSLHLLCTISTISLHSPTSSLQFNENFNSLACRLEILEQLLTKQEIHLILPMRVIMVPLMEGCMHILICYQGKKLHNQSLTLYNWWWLLLLVSKYLAVRCLNHNSNKLDIPPCKLTHWLTIDSIKQYFRIIYFLNYISYVLIRIKELCQQYIESETIYSLRKKHVRPLRWTIAVRLLYLHRYSTMVQR